MSTIADTSGAGPAMPVPGTETPAATAAPSGTPPPGSQHAKVAVRTELRTETPRATAVPVPAAATAGATAAPSGTPTLVFSAPTAGATSSVPPATAPPPGSQPAQDDGGAAPSAPTPSEIAMHVTGAATTGAAASVPTVPPPGEQDPAHDDLPVPKYLDPDWVKTGIPDTKFYKDYPPDAWGQEAAPNARVWKIYRDEMTAADADTLKSWNGTLDVLLIFAGLFSAVSTAFIIESYKSLQPDYTQYIANYLYTAANSNPGVGSFPFPSILSMRPPDNYVHPSATQRWTNGLWFTSLAVSLTVALLCILVKQWLDQYGARMKRSVPSFQGWVRRHQIYFPGLDKWGVPGLISLLPLLLHISLFLFFAGLVLFLRPLDDAIAFMLLAILILTVLFYLLSLILPVFYIDCPSYTPLLAQARSLITFGLGLLARLSRTRPSRYVNAASPHKSMKERIQRAIKRNISDAHDLLEKLHTRTKQRFARETTAIEAQKFILDGQALNTLLVATNDPDVIDAGVEAIGAVTAETTLEIVEGEGPREVIGERSNQDSLSAGEVPSAFAVLTDARRLRTLCALRTLYRFIPYSEPKIVDFNQTLGLDGVMLGVVIRLTNPLLSRLPDAEWRLHRGLQRHVTHLTEAQADDGASPVPLRLSPYRLDRTTCQLFLRNMYMHVDYRMDPPEQDVACVLLAFCAGDFAEAQPHERASAIQNLLSLLRQATDAGTPIRTVLAGKTNGVARNALGRLFDFLATHQELLTNDNVACPFIHHLGLVSQSLYRRPGDMRRDQLAGFAAFTLSPIFAQNVSCLGLRAYIKVLCCAAIPTLQDSELSQQYWTSFAALLVLQHDFAQVLDNSVGSRIRYLLAEPARVINVFGRASDTVLLKLFRVATALKAGWIEFTALGLSYLLCHRLLTQPLSDELIQSLFTGSFLTDQFHGLIGSALPRNVGRVYVMKLARHCARLSDRLPPVSQSETDSRARPLDAMLRICDELENPSNAEDALDDDALAVLAEIRRGLEPGGELRRDCDPSCECSPQPEPQHPAEPSSRITRWRNRIRGPISAAPEPAVELADMASIA